MLPNAFPANATPVPVVIAAVPEGYVHDTPTLPAWAASVGRLAADVAALVFVLPVPSHFRTLFEDAVRQEVGAALLGEPAVSAGECQRMEDIAWLAFDRRLAMHTVNQWLGGEG